MGCCNPKAINWINITQMKRFTPWHCQAVFFTMLQTLTKFGTSRKQCNVPDTSKQTQDSAMEGRKQLCLLYTPLPVSQLGSSQEQVINKTRESKVYNSDECNNTGV